MDMNWMGRYRTLVMALVQHSNITMRGVGIKDRITDDIWLNAHEWQVLEYIIEHTEDDAYMNRMSEVLGLPQSSFSRSVSLLSSYGLVEKYQTESNRKNVLLRPTEKGIQVYKDKYSQLDNELFADFFKSLDGFDDETIKRFSEALLAFNKVLTDDEDMQRDMEGTHYGFIAQDVQKIPPEIVYERDGQLSVNYLELIPLLVQKVQELSAEVETLKTQIK